MAERKHWRKKTKTICQSLIAVNQRKLIIQYCHVISVETSANLPSYIWTEGEANKFRIDWKRINLLKWYPGEVPVFRDCWGISRFRLLYWAISPGWIGESTSKFRWWMAEFKERQKERHPKYHSQWRTNILTTEITRLWVWWKYLTNSKCLCRLFVFFF